MKAVELELDQEDWFAIWTESIGVSLAKRSDHL
jgi:predicted oxidoreductase